MTIDYSWTNGTKVGTHVCTGNTGHPPGTLSLEVKDGESGIYRNYTPSIITNTTTFENCTNKATISFSIDFAAEHLQGDYIRCVSNNRETSESPFYSQEVLINPLPGKLIYITKFMWCLIWNRNAKYQCRTLFLNLIDYNIYLEKIYIYIQIQFQNISTSAFRICENNLLLSKY